MLSDNFARFSVYAVPLVIGILSIAAYQNINYENINHGFCHIESKLLPELNAVGHLYQHKRHGSPFLYIETKDDHNFFSISFRTPPIDNKGTTHVLKHLVSHGSEKYPIRSVFLEMSKRSIATYMNSISSTKWTAYPFSTVSEEDFRNLLNVYLDSVFHPRLTPVAFLSECHHLEFESLTDTSSHLKHSGVVYNELNGASSKPSEVFKEQIYKNLYNDSVFKYSSDGTPQDITKLTLESVKEHHSKYYHPSNSLFFYYGSMKIDEILDRVDKVISPFKQTVIHIDALNMTETPWEKPRSVSTVGPIEDDPSKTVQAVSWVVGDLRNYSDTYDMNFLSKLLCSSAVSPMYKGLIKSGFGSKLVYPGYHPHTRSPAFIIGANGVPENESLPQKVIAIMQNIVKEGFDKSLIKSLLHSIEMDEKEVSENTGMDLWKSTIKYWIHDIPPLDILDQKWEVDRIRSLLKLRPRYFENLLQKKLINNQHRLDFIMRGKKDYAESNAAATASELNEIAETMTKEQKDEIVQRSLEIRKVIESSKPLEKLPSITLDDLDRITPNKQCKESNGIFTFDRPTNGIYYIRLAFDVPLDSDLLSLPILGLVLPHIGSDDLKEEAFEKEVNLKTGGISCDVTHFMDSKDSMRVMFVVTVSSLKKHLGHTIDLLKKMVTDPHFQNIERIKQIVKESTDNIKEQLTSNGEQFAVNFASAGFSKSDTINEMFSGITQLKHRMELEKMREEDIASTIEKAFSSLGTVKASIHAPKSSIGFVQEILKPVLSKLNKREPVHLGFNQIDTVLAELKDKKKSLIELDSKTYFCAIAYPGHFYTERKDISRKALAQLMISELLFDSVHEKLGAHGVNQYVSQFSGTTAFASYRDTSPAKVLEAFKDALAFSRESITQEMVSRSAIKLISSIDAPQAPGSSMVSCLHANSCNTLYSNRIRMEYFNLTPRDIMDEAEELLKEEPTIVIVGSKALVPEGFETIAVAP